ncbi:MAG: oligoendopeptidase F, partial [Synergistales bacterium]|nr:oligoendopeptidase F [Synergistales bacterium]
MVAKGKKHVQKHILDPGGEIPERDQIDARFKWGLDHIYPDLKSMEQDFSRVALKLEEFSSFRNRLGESPELFRKCMELEEDLGISMGRILVYCTMRSHEDTRNNLSQGLADRAMNLMVRFSTVTSFIVPEITGLHEDILKSYLSEEDLSLYRFMLEDILRQKEHVLTPPEEEIIARAGELSHAPENIFSMLSNADMKFPSIPDEEGRRTELTEERYIRFIRSTDRKVRKKAFMELHKTYGKFENSLCAMYSSNIKSDIFHSRTRKYDSCLEGSLNGDNIPPSVYDNVVNTVNLNLEPLHEYVALRKKVLGLKSLHMYDLYVPLAKETRKDIPYEEALETVREGLSPLGEEYLSLLEKGFTDKWIDVFENRGKRKGAYSWGSYGTHPYVLLNYNGTLRDVFTIAHEMGHALHSWYSHREQPYIYGDYSIFLAEVASTTNEALLMNHLLSRDLSREERIYLLNYQLEQIRTTVYRQAMFAEFERDIHTLAEEGRPVIPDLLKSYWHELNQKYYGPSIVVDAEIDMEWARIPH